MVFCRCKNSLFQIIHAFRCFANLVKNEKVFNVLPIFQLSHDLNRFTECSFDRSGRRGKTSYIWKSRPTSAKPTWSTAHSVRTADSATGPATDSTAAASCAAVAAITRRSANYPKTATASSSGAVESCVSATEHWLVCCLSPHVAILPIMVLFLEWR